MEIIKLHAEINRFQSALKILNVGQLEKAALISRHSALRSFYPYCRQAGKLVCAILPACRKYDKHVSDNSEF